MFIRKKPEHLFHSGIVITFLQTLQVFQKHKQRMVQVHERNRKMGKSTRIRSRQFRASRI